MYSLKEKSHPNSYFSTEKLGHIHICTCVYLLRNDGSPIKSSLPVVALVSVVDTVLPVFVVKEVGVPVVAVVDDSVGPVVVVTVLGDSVVNVVGVVVLSKRHVKSKH